LILAKNSELSRIGNLYKTLDVRKKSKLMYTVCFYVQRTLIVIILAARGNFGIQTILIQFVLLLNAGYLFSVRPYRYSIDALTDKLNTIAIIVLQSFYLATSNWVTDVKTRFYFGTVYDGLIVVMFSVNVLIIIYIA